MTTTLTMAGLGDWLIDLFFRAPAGSEFGETADGVFMFIFWWSVVLFVGLMGLMFWFMWKYRRRPGAIGPRSASHNTPLELFWTIVPTIFLVFMFFYGFWGYADALVAPTESLLLDVRAQQWSWTVNYPNGAGTGKVMSTPGGGEAYDPAKNNPTAPIQHLGAVKIPLIVVPVNTPVQLRMISADVIHAFWVPDFRIKFDVMPNRYTAVWFHAREDQIGDHWVFCAEYCGKNHSEMLAVIRVVPQDQFEAVMREWGPEGMPPVEYGEFLYNNKGCFTCHSIGGEKNTGPTWQNLYGYEFEYKDGSKILADDNHIRESILTPSKHVRLGFPDQMPPFAGQLNEKAVAGLIAYIRTLSDKGGPPPGAAPTTEGEANTNQAGGTAPPAGETPPAATPPGGR